MFLRISAAYLEASSKETCLEHFNFILPRETLKLKQVCKDGQGEENGAG